MQRAVTPGLVIWLAGVVWLHASVVAADDGTDAIDLGGAYTGDFFANVAGGEARGVTHLGMLELRMLVDLDEAVGWTDAHVFVHTLTVYGGNPSADLVGDAQLVDNLEASIIPFSLFEAWLEQELFANHLSVLVGYYALDSEFDTSRTGALFLHSAHGTGNALASSGPTGPSIFPVTSFGGRVRVVPVVGTYLQAAVLDGRSGNLGGPNGARFFGDGAGLLIAYEAGFLMGTRPRGRGPGVRRRYVRRELEGHYDLKLALGGWAYTAPHDLVASSGQRRGDVGFYGVADALLFREREGTRQGLSFFARAGAAEAAFNRYPLHVGGGLAYQGVFPERDRDELGLAVAAAFTGAPFRRARAEDGLGTDAAEVALELTYNARLTDWLTMMGDAQYVLNPSADPAVDDAFVLIVRAQLVI